MRSIPSLGVVQCTTTMQCHSFFGLYSLGVTDCNILGCTIEHLIPTNNFTFSKITLLRLLIALQKSLDDSAESTVARPLFTSN